MARPRPSQLSTWERECISVPALAAHDLGAFRCGTQVTSAAPLLDLPSEVELGQSPYEWTAKRSEAGSWVGKNLGWLRVSGR